MPPLTPCAPLSPSEQIYGEGVTHITLHCTCYKHYCWHSAHVTVDSLPVSGERVPFLKRHFRCSKCGCRPTDSRPAWHTRKGVTGVPDHPDAPGYPQLSIWPRGVLGRR